MLNRLWIGCLVLSTTLLSGSQVAGQTSPVSSWHFRCPLQGTRVDLSGGGSIAFRGRDNTDPLVCLNGNDARRFLNYWFPDTDLVRSGRQQIATLFPAVVGKQVSYIFSTADSRTHQTITVRATWVIAGTGELRVPAGTFDAIKIESTRETIGGNWRQKDTIWLDRITGTILKVAIDFAGGVAIGNQRSWEITYFRAAP